MRFSTRILLASALFALATLVSRIGAQSPSAPAPARPSGIQATPAAAVRVAVPTSPTGGASNAPILENGNFDNPTDPLKGWLTDYEWTGNQYYVGNKKFVSIATEGARKNVVKFGNAGDGGVKMECKPFPLEPGQKYTCTFDSKGSAYRVYFAGYKWLPGIRPHDNPQLSELRMIYQSKALIESNPDWKSEKIELPGVALSGQAMEALKQVRFLTVYFWMKSPGEVDNVAITKTPDPSMNF